MVNSHHANATLMKKPIKEAVIQRYSLEKVFLKQAANLLENTHAEV